MRHSEGSLYSLIEAAHPWPQWACLRQVRDGAGWDRRTCDALAMGLWSSRGFTLRGFEIKVSRGDWKREADEPAKAEAVARYCDEWWLVTSPGIVRDPEIELPPTWGLMVPDDTGKALRVARKAGKLEPLPVSRGFLAQLFKGARQGAMDVLAGWVPRESIAEQIEKAEADGRRQGECDAGQALTELRRCQAEGALFKAATGIDPLKNDGLIDGKWIYDARRYLAAGRALLGNGHDPDVILQDLDAAAKIAEGIAARLRALNLPTGESTT